MHENFGFICFEQIYLDVLFYRLSGIFYKLALHYYKAIKTFDYLVLGDPSASPLRGLKVSGLSKSG